ncbi:MAG: protein-L-isoaspartate(D-aspartate) O-methyltransferase [Bryobacterales bacterium]|nr:protein-L-isoaspartate(D-aspartate) O-methyltransferase [Bryobacterales bacterium]
MLLGCASSAAQQKARLTMVKQQIEDRGVKNPRVLQAMRATPRHLFVPKDMEALAYEDRPLPIGDGQTISQPYIVALMSELLDVSPTHRVLEIGTGSGYQAAILAQLAKQVYSIEIVPKLAIQAEALLRQQNHSNVRIRVGDGYLGWPEEAPFDRIILTAAPPSIPRELIRQLRPEGKLVAPEGVGNQDLVVIEKSRSGSIQRRNIIPVAFVPMVHGRN